MQHDFFARCLNGFQTARWHFECRWSAAQSDRRSERILHKENADFHKPILEIAVEQLFCVHFLCYSFDLVCRVTFSCKKKKKKIWVAHPQVGFSNQLLIHNLHIFLRVDICQADMGQFVDFVVTSVTAQISLPASSGGPGCLVFTAGQCPTTLETQECLSTGSAPCLLCRHNPTVPLASTLEWNAPLNIFHP